ncbi:pyridoxal phosphate-dependent aminotransferase [Providencia hangzhouensis]|uniref:Aminotransferase class I/II-fold pyridoxal phosphate-dependent enzyme n=1 Tax=Providencia rettgeri TaxID=587 RepID=A0AAE2ZES6_PRORE|nr:MULTISPECIES: aminotransferase class I/II-fold pyridoxal phosphate-dependent enzyme [Providencia]MBW3118579.1 aminotransferase class I/II-fold pyridoxal phosphate-dependent enzyme [Providencia rettgeri]MCK9791520.1 aminotransferase class I/II-fold pyridoxal phosphate-dependent enzyme [Providencia rettgeri]MDX7422798.1 aminotransferase class I/II-fold pyridoxal phosphate-dependent enzyme [Providencia sp. CIM-Carb-044]NHN51594.1 aminotransferase class I/II-fold pyridoxal phosphate-dependent en
MDRRSFLKSSSLVAGGLALNSLFNHAVAQNSNIVLPSEKHPLLLNFNENSLGMSEKAKEAIIKALPNAFRYPDDARAELQKNIGELYSLSDENISIGNGSSETIQATVAMLANKAKKRGINIQLVTPDPTFNYAELYSLPLGVTITKIPLKTDLSFDLAKMEQAANDFDGLSMVYICNPNNPTAMITPYSQLDKWLSKDSDNTFFIVDEAYAEFVEDPNFTSAIELVKKGQNNLIVTRTFSKIFALAGLRVGYGVATPEIIAAVDTFLSIDNTNTAGAVAAIASLKDKSFIQYSLKSNDISRKIVEKALNKIGLEYAPSQANFIFHKVKGDVKTYQQRMADAHVMVGREFPPAVGWNRLTLGTPEEMQQFVVILKQFHEKGWV